MFAYLCIYVLAGRRVLVEGLRIHLTSHYNYVVFLYLCICVFVCLCICVFVHIRIAWAARSGGRIAHTFNISL